MSQQGFENLDEMFEKSYEEKGPKFDKSINIAVVGKVSAGKSSLLNAILGCRRSEPLAEVGAHSGVTTRVIAYKLDDHVLIIDCPGLDDVRDKNSAETIGFLSSIDLGIFVVTGSADASQKANYSDLKNSSGKVIVVLNKIDEWDDLEESACETVIKQWKSVLGVDRVFGTCTKGYDPKMRKNAPMDLRGIEEVREEIFDFLYKNGKDLLLARHLRDKEGYAIRILGIALVAVAAEAFIPGSAALITATQVTAIASLVYLYTGDVISKSSVIAMLPAFVGESVGANIFLWVKSFLPPTGIIDVAAAGVALVITFAMLAAVKWVLENGYSLEQTDLLKKAFKNFESVGAELKNVSFSDLRNSASVIRLSKRLLAGG